MDPCEGCSDNITQWEGSESKGLALGLVLGLGMAALLALMCVLVVVIRMRMKKPHTDPITDGVTPQHQTRGSPTTPLTNGTNAISITQEEQYTINSVEEDEATLSKKQTQISGLEAKPRYSSISDRPLFQLPDDSARLSSRLSTTVSNLEASISPTPVTAVRDTNTRWCKIKLALQKNRQPSVEEDGYVNEGLGPQTQK